MLQYEVPCDLVEHAFKSGPTRFHEIKLEPANTLLFGRRWYDDARIVLMQLLVEPQEITVSS